MGRAPGLKNKSHNFDDKHKQEFIAGLIDPIKDGNQRARAVDACIMNGAPFPDLKD